MVKYYDRQRQQIVQEQEFQGNLVNQLYQGTWGGLFRPLVTRPFFSKLLSLKDYQSNSKKEIESFIQSFGIDMSQFEDRDYDSFADFFTRDYKPDQVPVASQGNVIAVADGKLQVFQLDLQSQIRVKGQAYTLTELTQDSQLANKFQGGTLLLFRLAMNDCHHYLAAEAGKVSFYKQITGKLHSIRQVAQGKVPVFKENQREVTVIETEAAYPVLQIEVGALLAGKIHNYWRKTYDHGEAKGYFSLGGSTIIVVYPQGKVVIDQDILEYSQLDMETQVRRGEKIGVKI